MGRVRSRGGWDPTADELHDWFDRIQGMRWYLWHLNYGGIKVPFWQWRKRRRVRKLQTALIRPQEGGFRPVLADAEQLLGVHRRSEGWNGEIAP
jgi:hypothetical protein